jgi:hypothetical protein
MNETYWKVALLIPNMNTLIEACELQRDSRRTTTTQHPNTSKSFAIPPAPFIHSFSSQHINIQSLLLCLSIARAGR